MSLIPELPLNKVVTSDKVLPTLDLRAGVGLSTALLSGRRSASGGDPELHWGLGVRYPIGHLWRDDSIGIRIDAIHSVQFETRVGNFIGVTVGFEKLFRFDRDGDGITDDADKCPDEAEDFDSFLDDDGCPDWDNDGDGIDDEADACPDNAEDMDSYQDEDGCPDPDNDGDQILDTADSCPLRAEDHDQFEDEDGCPDPDNDGDQILDAKDKCPLEPEDVDGFEDADGCPDPDNDSDGLPDAADKCPNQPEDFEGFQDEDGCPDAKNDKDGDGIADKLDKCPNDAEDKDGFEDEDGCPDPDNDKDGVLDATDGCPMEPEDVDGFEDTDGCPDYDNDLDGIPDAQDKCPNQSETINGVDDDDGCPDQGAQLVKLTAEKIEISDKVYFAFGSDELLERSFLLLNQIAALLKNHTEVPRIRVEGHTDDRGSDDFNLDLSARRAKSVVRYLEGRGIDPARLEGVGIGEARPVASNRSEAGREMNRRVEFIVVQAPGAMPVPPPTP